MSEISDNDIQTVREFNRFYTKHIGLLTPKFFHSSCTFLEARLIFEIGVHQPVTASRLSAQIGIDGAQISRILKKFEDQTKWITKGHVENDSRVKPITLTQEGEAFLAELNDGQNKAVASRLKELSPSELQDVVSTLSTGYLILNKSEQLNTKLGFHIRHHETGDIALLVSRQVKMYKETMSWGTKLEIIVMETATNFMKSYKEGRDACFIAEINRSFAGGVMISDEGDGTARLRLFHVEQSARRRGIGNALVLKCIEFAREKRYQRIILWTHKVLEAARRIYYRNGFKPYVEFVHDDFGEPVESEMWRLELSDTQKSGAENSSSEKSGV